jgi:hypothetical protein
LGREPYAAAGAEGSPVPHSGAREAEFLSARIRRRISRGHEPQRNSPEGAVTIQFYPDELDYVNAQLHPLSKCGAFLESFFQSCLRADGQNYELLRPILKEFIVKYPANPERLAVERRDRGLSKGFGCAV